jgi:carboxypeptidase C (cathepsin A)
VYLNFGAIGPKKVNFGVEGDTPSQPATLHDNPGTWLGFTDLVFIDPVGTGYSRALVDDKEATTQFYSTDNDIKYLSRIVYDWLVKSGRMTSRKYLVGESYGGFRGPLLAKKLASAQGIGVGGLILISPVLDFHNFVPGPNDPFPFLTRLPSFAAAYREKKGPVSRADLADVEQYAAGEYLQDWLRGPRDAAAVARMEQRVAELTGLDPRVSHRFGGRIGKGEFLREFERAQGKMLAFYDASIDAYDPFPISSRSEFLDPVLPGFDAPFSSAIMTLYQQKLGWKIEDRYELLNEAVGKAWNWGKGLSPPNAIEELRQMLALDPNFRVLVSHGLTDLQAPYFASALELAQIPDFGPPGRLTLTVHPGGHMHYSRDDTRKALREEASRLILRP